MSKKKTFRLSRWTPLADVPFDAMLYERDRLYEGTERPRKREEERLRCFVK